MSDNMNFEVSMEVAGTCPQTTGGPDLALRAFNIPEWFCLAGLQVMRCPAGKTAHRLEK